MYENLFAFLNDPQIQVWCSIISLLPILANWVKKIYQKFSLGLAMARIEEKDIENPCKTSPYMEIFDNLIYLQFLKKKYCITLEPYQIIKFEEINKLLGKRYSLGIRRLIYPYLNPFDDFKSIHRCKTPTRLQWFCGLILIFLSICVELIWVWLYIKISVLLNGWYFVIAPFVLLFVLLFYFLIFLNFVKDLLYYIKAFNALKYINRKDDSKPVKEASFIKLIFIAPFSNNWKKM